MLGTLLTLFLVVQAPPAPEPAIYDYRVVATYPHDRGAYTQGLIYRAGELYESTGRVGTSFVRRVRLRDGRVRQQAAFPAGQFGEGLVDWGEQLLTITWTDGVGQRWDRRTLRRLGQWRYPGEGWGLTRSATEIVMSDGTSQLRFLDPATLAERRRLNVTLRGRPLARLNELEWVRGEIYANVWMTPYIARIDPTSGVVIGLIDLTRLAAENSSDDDAVLNGIAYDPAGDRLFVTGKLWPRLYEIDLVRRANR